MASESNEDPALILWPTSAVEGAMAERDRLLGIIDRAQEVIDSTFKVDLTAKGIDLPKRQSIGVRLRGYVACAERVRSILAEADPADLEASEGEGRAGG